MGEPPSKPSSPAIDPLVKVVKLPLVRSSFIAVKKGVTPMVGIGLIGAVRIAQIHAKAYTNVAGARLLAVADILPEAANRTANTFRLDAYTTTTIFLRETISIVSSSRFRLLFMHR